MPYGRPNERNAPGWLDIGEYLGDLRRATGRSWCVCIATTGEQSKARAMLLSVCEYRAGAPVVRDDLGITAGAWPSGSHRDMEAAVLDLLYRFDRKLADREQESVAQAAF